MSNDHPNTSKDCPQTPGGPGQVYPALPPQRHVGNLLDINSDSQQCLSQRLLQRYTDRTKHEKPQVKDAERLQTDRATTTATTTAKTMATKTAKHASHPKSRQQHGGPGQATFPVDSSSTPKLAQIPSTRTNVTEHAQPQRISVFFSRGRRHERSH